MKRTFNIIVLITLLALNFGAVGATPAHAILLYALGIYPATSVVLGGNTTVTPDVAPTDTTSIHVSTDTNFKGTFAADPATGVVRVTNAHPAGTYTVTVQAFGASPATTTFILTVTSGTVCTGMPNFISAGIVSTEAGSGFVAVGDFNSDSNQDFANANADVDTVSIRLGNGAGGFTSPAIPQISAGDNPRANLVGDFNGDGKQDLAVPNFNPQNVSIRLGDGAGGFGNAPDVSVAPGTPQSIVGGDFNNDGKLDFATANSDAIPATVSIRLGDGAGNFSGTTNVTVGNNNAYDLAAGDFNDDGNLDIAVVNFWDYNVAVLLGDGTGGMGSPTNYSMGTMRPLAVTVGDFNNDGNQDLVVSGQFENTVQILLGNGAGVFTVGTSIAIAGPKRTAVGDFNNDGNQDLAIMQVNDNRVAIYGGNGSGGFTFVNNFSVGTTPYSIAVGDFNNDGKQDFATANNVSGNVSVFLGECDLTTHTVTFHANGGTGTMALQVSSVPAALTANAFARSGYSFAGWDTAADGSGTFYADGATYDFSANITLYAQWNQSPVIDIVLPISSNGSNLFSTINLSDPENDPLSGVISIFTGTGVPISVTFETLTTCGSYGGPAQLSLNGGLVGQTPMSPNCTCGDTMGSVVFNGPELVSNFNMVGNNTWTYTNPGSGGYTAWARASIQYADGSTQTTCLFDATGGDCTEPEVCNGMYWGTTSGSAVLPASTVVYASVPYANSTLPASLDVSTIAPGTYTLYADASDGFNSPASDVEPITLAGEGLLYINASTVTFDGNGGSGAMAPQVSGVPTALNANTFTRTDYTFAGWGTVPGGPVAYADGAVYDFSADITLYAQWTANTHIVTFDSNGGSGSMSPQMASTTTPLTLNAFTRTGYSFAGWGTVPGGPVVYADGADYDFLADIILYAQWTANTHTVTFDSQGGSPTPGNQTVAYGALVTDPGAPTRTGYTFNGWFTASSGGTQWNFATDTMGAGDMTLFAQWTAYTEQSATFTSVAYYDGLVFESSENTGIGGLANAISPFSMVGDHTKDRQIRGFLHFDTSSLPDNAVITNITLSIKRQNILGAPFTTLGTLQADIASPFFGTKKALQPADFQAVPVFANAGAFDPAPAAGDWYSAGFDPASFSSINLAGPTQFRLAFSIEDDDDLRPDALVFYSGNYRIASYRPVLVVTYYIP